jgi:hypothetical protein
VNGGEQHSEERRKNITLDLDADDRLAGSMLGANEEILLTGQVEDNQKAAARKSASNSPTSHTVTRSR